MALAAGDRLGPYEIAAPIGAGGMGEVYEARDTRLERLVALKILPASDPERQQRFAREAKAIGGLNALFQIADGYEREAQREDVRAQQLRLER